MSDTELNVIGDFKYSKSESVQVNLKLVQFKSDGAEVLYAPALELYGYGNTFEEARKSFAVSLHEFLIYTKEHGTLETEMERLGWKIKVDKKKKIYTTPTFSELLLSNPRLVEIVNNKDFQTHRADVPLAMA